MTIDKCPICGGKLQATEVQEIYWDSLTFLVLCEDENAPTGIEIDPDQSLDGASYFATKEWHLYCENDHDEYSILAALETQTASS